MKVCRSLLIEEVNGWSIRPLSVDMTIHDCRDQRLKSVTQKTNANLIYSSVC
jgi:hypothetical protein